MKFGTDYRDKNQITEMLSKMELAIVKTHKKLHVWATKLFSCITSNISRE